MGLGGDHDHAGRGRAAESVLQELHQVEVPQVVHLEGGLQAVLREAPGQGEGRGVAHEHVERPEKQSIRQSAGVSTPKPMAARVPQGRLVLPCLQGPISGRRDALEGPITEWATVLGHQGGQAPGMQDIQC